ncbi:TSUP family transporter [Faecalicoccus pleomorphus]|uniref:Na+/solute symporter n=1 Tax=Faecalicoccus pleomorphus TaxID=1323 RepID=A0A380LQX7_9FIRM|nr:TSUP family transporter [Faecalicoccus pleomorphus]MDM8292563.1 TSUP family transporter [Faecalicoccus pleomorphus]NME45358.1 TSUP family transporter [Faecalicoccus pleomorphus]SUO04266.1 Na+/solute symporter [Faecalicoccus pleomorphus]
MDGINIVQVILILVVLVNGLFAIRFVLDVLQHKEELKEEPGNPVAMAIVSFFMFFLSTFGISDFAIGSSLYPKAKWVSDKKLPGTLNTECVIPVAVMALAYISSIEVGLLTLVTAIVCQVVGAYVSPRYVTKLPANQIKRFVAAGLFIAAGLILAGKFGIYPSGGELSSLEGGSLILFALLCMLFGALNNIGIGSYALTMATVYAMGLNPSIAFPIMMGACTFSVPIGSMQFIKLDSYSRKITLFTSTFGVLGVLVAAFVVKSLDVSALLWVVVVVVLYSAITMLKSSFNKEK